ncbi:MAG: hypothetical protein FWE21_04965 [Defluviitaleaceae bacterium]|nr:hypothetical protein [Defluviitaleaceae bacterium]
MDYVYLTEIQGIALIRLALGSETIERLDIDFTINLKERQFDFNVEKSGYIDMLDMHYLRKYDADEADFVYGFDVNNIPFTLYGCSICHLNAPLKEMRIVWNGIIIGKHISSKSDCYVINMKCIVEDAKNQYRNSVGRSEYKICSDMICVKTEWSSIKDGERKNNGAMFELTPMSPMSFEKIKDCFFTLLEMYFMWIGYFPEIKDMRFFDGEDEFIYAEHSKGIHQSKKSAIHIERRLFLENMDNFSDKFDKWFSMRVENIPVFTVFLNVLYSRDMFEEVKTSTLIQCLEGYFTTHHDKEMMIYDKKRNRLIVKTALEAIKNSDEIKNSFDEVLFNEVITSIENSLGRINKKSLRKILLFAIERTPLTKKIFEYERNTDTPPHNKTLFDVFISKAVNHRNFISHLFKTDDYFKYDENKLAMQKLELLLRLSLLHDIGLEVTEKSVYDYIDLLNKRHYEQPQKPQFP